MSPLPASARAQQLRRNGGSPAGLVTESLVRRYVHEAVADLRGSVSSEALPEMAARLAHYRLSRASARGTLEAASAARVVDR